MDVSCNTDMFNQHDEFDTETTTTCAKTTQTSNDFTEEPNSINPISNDGITTPYSNTNTLYDALPISDSVIGNLDVVSANITSNEVKQSNCSITMSDNKPQNSQNPSTEGSDKKQAGNALSQLLDYGMSDSEDTQSDSEESLSDSDTHSDNEENISTQPNVGDANVVPNTTKFRENVSSSDSSSEYESDSSSSFSDIGACGGTPAPENKPTPEKMGPPRTKGEVTLEELPPIDELKISVSEDECIEVGVVTSIIDQLVIVQSLRGTPAYDIDTLFFLNRGKSPLGRVFDVLGPITEPLYAIRFNSYEQALETGVKTGTPVYCAPRTQHTSYVFVSELMKMKGSDASWEHNNEPPDVFLDYSDDEEERAARRQRKKAPTPAASKSNSLERQRRFEKQMNDKNLLMTERYKSQSSAQAAARSKKKPEATVRGPVPGPAVGAPPPPPWLPMPWPPQPQPYQFAAYPPYAPALAMFPPRQHFVMGPAPPAVFHAPQPFNPAVPPPHVMRPQPQPQHQHLGYFPKPRHPPWHPLGVGVGVLQPPTQHAHNYGNGSSYTQ